MYYIPSLTTSSYYLYTFYYRDILACGYQGSKNRILVPLSLSPLIPSGPSRTGSATRGLREERRAEGTEGSRPTNPRNQIDSFFHLRILSHKTSYFYFYFLVHFIIIIKIRSFMIIIKELYL